MANGLPRTQKYARLDTANHLFALDDDLDEFDSAMVQRDEKTQAQLTKMNSTLVWILRTFVGLLVAVLAVLVTVVLTNGH